MIIVPPPMSADGRRRRARGNPVIAVLAALAAAGSGLLNIASRDRWFDGARASPNWPWYLAGGGLLLALAVAFVVVLVVRSRDAQSVDAEGANSSSDDSCGVDPRRRLVLVALAMVAFILAGVIAYGHRR